jgi:predicted DNA binding CopG/RHH family protein
MTTKKVSFENKSKKKADEVKDFNPDEWVSTGDNAEDVPTIRFTIDIPTELHTRIKAQCAAKRVKMKEVIQELLEKAFPSSKNAKA